MPAPVPHRRGHRPGRIQRPGRRQRLHQPDGKRNLLAAAGATGQPQAAGFTLRQAWDFAHTTAEQYPLILHFPCFDLYRKQVVKQADPVLAMHLHGSAFTDGQKAANFAYYESLTVRDSSLRPAPRRPSPPRSVTLTWPTTTSARPP
jgi:Glycosyl hydrolase family 65 central catalytic domain